MCEIFHSLNMRSQRGSTVAMTFKGSHNKYLFGSCLLSLLMTTIVIYVPFLSNAFGFESIDLGEYAVALALAFAIIPLVEIIKAIERAYDKKKAKK